jgi:hypothetical protein
MKLAIVGSRDFSNYDLLVKSIEQNLDVSQITHIVSGGARGADTLGELFAKNNNIDTIIYKPDWNKYGRSAGYIRNKDIIDSADFVIAFWDGKSKGTKHSIDLANNMGKPIVICKF